MSSAAPDRTGRDVGPVLHLAQARTGGIDLVTVEQLYIAEIELASAIRLKFAGVECDDRLAVAAVACREPGVKSQAGFNRFPNGQATRIMEDRLNG